MIRSAGVAIALVFACCSATAQAAGEAPGTVQPYSFAELLRVTEQTAAELAGGAPNEGARSDPDAAPREAAQVVLEPGPVQDAPPPPRAAASLLGAMDVPQPAGWLMLASGLAIAGFIGRRRAKPLP